MEIVRDGEKLNGILLTPARNGMRLDTTAFTGTRLPEVGPAPDLSALKYGEPINLFNGTDLTGWRLINEKQANGFKVVDGMLVNDPVQKEGEPHVSYGNLRTEKEFEDFNLKLEVNVPAGNNSGVYLRGMYEIQVVDSYKRPLIRIIWEQFTAGSPLCLQLKNLQANGRPSTSRCASVMQLLS